MFKKLFRRLTQSKAERYLDELEQFAQSIEKRGAPQLAYTMRHFAGLKQDIDTRLESNDASMLQIDNLEQLAESVCDGVREKIDDLAKQQGDLPDVLVSQDGERFSLHMKQWRQGNELLLRAYAALHYAASGVSSPNLDSLTAGDVENSRLKETIEALRLEIRTAVRIETELGR